MEWARFCDYQISTSLPPAPSPPPPLSQNDLLTILIVGKSFNWYTSIFHYPVLVAMVLIAVVCLYWLCFISRLVDVCCRVQSVQRPPHYHLLHQTRWHQQQWPCLYWCGLCMEFKGSIWTQHVCFKHNKLNELYTQLLILTPHLTWYVWHHKLCPGNYY